MLIDIDIDIVVTFDLPLSSLAVLCIKNVCVYLKQKYHKKYNM